MHINDVVNFTDEEGETFTSSMTAPTMTFPEMDVMGRTPERIAYENKVKVGVLVGVGAAVLLYWMYSRA